MRKMTNVFYYDELMNQDSTTFSVYNNKDEDDTDEAYISYSGKNSKERKEILRGVLDIDPSISTSVAWSAAPSNLTSTIANLSKTAMDSYRFMENAVSNFSNFGDSFKAWNQAKYFSVNEFAKIFQGYGTSTPLNFRTSLYPYIDKNGKYQSVTAQLEALLGGLYPTDDLVSARDDFVKAAANVKYISDAVATKVKEKAEADDGFWSEASQTVINVVEKGKDLLGGAVTKLTDFLGIEGVEVNDIFTELDENLGNSLFKIEPPHGYTRVPNILPNGGWIYGTLGLRLGSRWILNLLLTSLDVSVSKEFTDYDGEIGPMMADINISFTPAILNTPKELRSYIMNQDLKSYSEIESNEGRPSFSQSVNEEVEAMKKFKEQSEDILATAPIPSPGQTTNQTTKQTQNQTSNRPGSGGRLDNTPMEAW